MAQKNPRSQAALVLIVDDDEAVVEITAEILGTLGYDVLIARNGPEAVELLRRNSCVSVLFTDIQMPGAMDGLRLARAVRGRWPPIKIVTTSGHLTVADTDLPEGGRFLPKPYSAHEVTCVLREVMAGG